MSSNTFNWEETPQLNWWQIVLAFLIPSAIGYSLFHGFLPIMVESGSGRLSSWAFLATGSLSLFLIVGIFLVRKEAQGMNLSFKERIGLKSFPKEEWKFYTGFIALILVLTLISTPITLAFMDLLNFYPPDYYPFMLDPRIDPVSMPESSFSPNEMIKGNLILIPLMIITLMVNILTEEVYFRGYLLPKMSKLGNLGWILNGTLFALYHTFQLWFFPTLIIASLAITFLYWKSRNIWLVFIVHFIGNVLLSALGIFALVLS